MTKTAKQRRKAAKARTPSREGSPLGERKLIQLAARWPVLEVLVSRDWAKEGVLAQVLVARQAPQRCIVFGAFMVDLGCLGVKCAFAGVLAGESAYRSRIREKMSEVQPLVRADLDLAAKIVREGLRYARSLGFEPDPDFGLAKRVLDGGDPDACAVPVPLGGKDGKPFYIAGPEDDPERVLRRLEGRLGRDGFHYIVPVRDPIEAGCPWREAAAEGRRRTSSASPES